MLQQTLFDIDEGSSELDGRIVAAVEKLSSSPAADRGAIFTKKSVAELILDLSGYVESEPIESKIILEPCFGGGDFLLPMADRLLNRLLLNKPKAKDAVSAIENAIIAIELHKETFSSTSHKLIQLIESKGIPPKLADRLASRWLRCADFLLEPIGVKVDIVVGNPPYLRQERIPPVLLEEYKRRYSTIYDRADLYIPFFEKSLDLLNDTGKLCFICADRWIKNRYGGPLRKKISKRFQLAAYINLNHTEAFHDDVTAYPAITLITRERIAHTQVVKVRSTDDDELSKVAGMLRQIESDQRVTRLKDVVQDDSPWLLDQSPALALIRRLEAELPSLEEAGCSVGIGVATGADKVFIGPIEQLDVEDSRKLPLVTTKDISSGRVIWSGLGVINPFEPDGTLAKLEQYPRFKAFIEHHKDVISARHVAKKSSTAWYRTIDRINPELAATPKLLIPDIKGEANIVFEPGELYPHHNLYYITSKFWDLRALQTFLRSGIAQLFVSNYTTKMRGGYFRFQAQYIRKIHIPLWRDVPKKMQVKLIETCSVTDPKTTNRLVCELLAISSTERKSLGWS